MINIFGAPAAVAVEREARVGRLLDDMAATRALVNQLAARWTACEDALLWLEGEADANTDYEEDRHRATAILRRAVRGEG